LPEKFLWQSTQLKSGTVCTVLLGTQFYAFQIQNEKRGKNLQAWGVSRSFEKNGLKKRLAWKSSKEGTIQNSLKMPCSGSRSLPEAYFKKSLAWSLLRGCVRAEGRETV